MNRIFKIAAIPLILLLFTAEQCGEPGEIRSQENLLDLRKNEIRSNFESEFLSESVLFEHEISAKQKLADLADYLRILTDTSLQQPFREKAAELVRNNFISNNSEIKILFEPGKYVRKMNLDFFIAQALHNQLPLFRCTFDSIKVDNSFRRIQEESYSAMLRFNQVPEKFQNTDSSGNFFSCKVEVLIGKENKVIGSDTLTVWEMYFGNIE